MKKVLLYLNQFFAGIGGEDMADVAPEFREDIKGPALAYKANLKDVEIIGAIICGDNYMGSKKEEALKEIDELLKGKEFDLFLAGPAFQAGRYGVACGTVAKHIQDHYMVPAISSMHEENPGVEMFKQDLYIMPGGRSAASMKKDVAAMASLAQRVLAGEKRIPQEEGGFFVRGIRHQVWREDGKCAADRVIDMLLKKVNGEEFVSELPIKLKERVAIAPPVKDLSKANIALITTGGIVPVDNPDRIQSASATRWGRYDISGMDHLAAGVFKTIHAGFDPAAADAHPDVVVPVDAMKIYEKQGVIGKLHNYFYSTVGTGTTENEAARMAQEMIPYLKEDGVNAIIMTSTWGTCTRCGATMVKELEKAGFAIVQMCNLIPVATTVGAYKIVPTISIPYPLGDPSTSDETQMKLRMSRVKTALDALTDDAKEQTVYPVK